MEILTSLHGRRFGLGPNDELILNRRDGVQNIIGAVVTKEITSAQVLALNATPQAVVASPGAGLAIVPRLVAIHKPAGTAYGGIAEGEDLVLKYTNGSGAQVSSTIETTGFLDQTSAQTRVGIAAAASVAPVADAAVVLHLLTDEITTGNSPLHVRVWYDVIATVFTA